MSFVKFKDIVEEKFDESNYLKTSFKEFDKVCLGFGRGQFILLTGTRGSGKTSISSQLQLNFINNGYKGLSYSLEMSNSRTKKWLSLQACGTNNIIERTSSTGKMLYFLKNDIIKEKISEWIDDKLLIDDNSSYSFKVIEENVKNQIEQKSKIDFIIIDNMTRMDIADFGSDKYLAQSRIAKRLQELCQKHNICLILICHPNKVKTCPRIEDVGGTGDLINFADMVILVHRVSNDFKYRAKEYFGWEDNNPLFNYANLIEIAKDREFGNEGIMIGLYFDHKCKRFLNFENENISYKWEEKPQQCVLEELSGDDLPF